MSDIKERAVAMPSTTTTKDVPAIAQKTENIYHSLAVIAHRAKYLSTELKRELTSKLEEFAVQPDNLEEIIDNREQIEISKFYEKLPNPAIIAIEEYLEDQIVFRYRDEETPSDDEELE